MRRSLYLAVTAFASTVLLLARNHAALFGLARSAHADSRTGPLPHPTAHSIF